MRFGVGLLVAGLLSWGALASSAFDPFADWTVDEFCEVNSWFDTGDSPMRLQEISLFKEDDGRSCAMGIEGSLPVKIEVEITGPQHFSASYFVGRYQRGEWYVAYCPRVTPLYGAHLDSGATIPLGYTVPLQTLMGPGPFRLYAGGLGDIDIPSLQGAQWKDGAVVLDY